MSTSNIFSPTSVSLSNLKMDSPCAVALGFFDGVHVGHVALLKHTKTVAEKNNLKPVVFTFSEHPSWLLEPERRVKLLCSLSERLTIIKNLGLQPLAVPFDRSLASMSPENFVFSVLCAQLKAAHIVVGYNYRFGYRAQGTVQTLEKLGRRGGFAVDTLECFSVAGQSVSSSRLRALIETGRLSEAADLWGRRYKVGGRIVHGRKVGRTLNIPTANVEIDPCLVTPPRGVFASICSLSRVQPTSGTCPDFQFPGLAYWGNRPTFDKGRDVLEVFLLTEPGRFGLDELYGWYLETEFIEMVRGQKHFPNSEAFVAQVAEDRRRIRQITDSCGLPN
ncbi:MAG: bifunctional riboflavin kinase/FMN adenylyltransferase [Candidatus Bruticola sp.]